MAGLVDLMDEQTGPTHGLRGVSLWFVQNVGQFDPRVRFLMHGVSGGTAWLTQEALWLALRSVPLAIPRGEESPAKGATIRIRFVGANPVPDMRGRDRQSAIINYYIGNDPARWRTRVPAYGSVVYRDLYPGVDLIYGGEGGKLKSTFLVAPGANPRAIRLAYEGVEALRLREDGALVLQVDGGELVESAPFIYQEVEGIRHSIPGRFVLLGEREVGFRVGPYDPSRPLVIDPTLAWSTYLGGNGNDEARAVTVDSSDKTSYVAGLTSSTDFPGTSGSAPGETDAFIAKFYSDGRLAFATYLGGTTDGVPYGVGGADWVNDISLSMGAVYVTGVTFSIDFPVKNAFQPGSVPGADAFITKLDSGSGALLYSTYLGGQGAESGEGVYADGNAVYVTGYTNSVDFPITNGAFQGQYGGGTAAGSEYGDAFVTKLDTAKSGASSLVYSTYLGGSGDDVGTDIVVDALDDTCYVTGWTESADYPIQGALQSALKGTTDAFVTKLNAAGTALIYSTYLGGSGGETGFGIVEDGGKVYVAGGTGSADFPVTNAYQSSYGGHGDGFITGINAAGTALLYSTFLGGSDSDDIEALALNDGKLYAVGSTSSQNFPTVQALYPTYGGGGSDAFVAELNPAQSGAASLLFSSFLGGEGTDIGLGIAVTTDGANIFVSGRTESDRFPTKAPYQRARAAYQDAFVVAIAAKTADLSVTKTASPQRVAPGGDIHHRITVSNQGPNAATSVMLFDILPAGTSFVSVAPSSHCRYVNDQVRCSWDTFAANSSVQVDITLKAPTQRGTITNTVEVVAWEFDPDPSDNKASAVVAVGGADLSLQIDGNPDPVRPEARLSYVIQIANNGPEKAVAPNLVDTLPQGVTFISVEPSSYCAQETGNPRLIKCILPDLAAGDMIGVDITVRAPQQTGVITNTVEVDLVDPDDPDRSNNRAAKAIYVGGADVAINQVDSPDPVAVGGDLTYVISLANHGPETATRMRVTDTLPAGVTFVKVEPLPGDPDPPRCTHSGVTITCDVGDVPANQGTMFFIKVKAPQQEGTITNHVTISSAKPDPDTSNNSRVEQTSVRQGADIQITMRDLHDPVATEGELTYKISVTNRGPEDATQVVVTDTLPAGVTFDDAGPDCTRSGNQIVCTVGSLASGAARVLTVNLKAPKDEGTIVNQVVARGREPDPDLNNNAATEQTVVEQGADIQVTNSDLKDPVAMGGRLVYNLTVTNGGPKVATNVRLTDTLPSGAAFVELYGANASACSYASGVVSCDFGTLSPGDCKDVSVELRAPMQEGTIENDVIVSAAEPDPSYFNNVAQEETTVRPGADLEPVILDMRDPVATEGEIAHNIIVMNNGPETATSLVVTDTLPTEMVVVTGTVPVNVGVISIPQECTHTGHTIICRRNTLAPNESWEINLRLKAPAQEGWLLNKVYVSAAEPDPNEDNNQDEEPTQVKRGARLEILKSDSADPVVAGTEFEYRITVSNVGPAPAKDVTVRDALPPGVAFISANPAPTSVGPPLIWNLGDLASPAVVNITLRVRAPAQTGSITNEVTVTSTTPDPDESDNQAAETTTIQPAPDADADGVSDQIEDGAPNNGDGNNDGIPDSQQDNVASLLNDHNEYATFVAPNGVQLTDVGIRPNPDPFTAPPHTTYPMGLYHFTIKGLTPGQAVTIRLILHPTYTLNTFWKYGPTPTDPLPHWYRFMYDGTTGVEIVDAHTLLIHLVDGQRGDDDLTANGEIVDPGGPAYQKLIVDTTTDSDDMRVGDGIAMDVDGRCSLRAAIQEANASRGADVIEFNIGGGGVRTIQPRSALPPITDPVTIDGTSQPNHGAGPGIELNGSLAGSSADGLVITGGHSTIRGLAINSFGGNGIKLSGGGGNVIQGNYIGTDVNGDYAARNNGLYGIYILNSANNLIGGTGVSDGNQISGNESGGVFITGAGSTGNLVQGNVIGTNPGGSAAVNNYGSGVQIEGGSGNTIGGTAAHAGNIISGNVYGVVISGTTASGNVVQGNLIGTDYLGAAEVKNFNHGVLIQDAPNNTIGGSDAAARNVIAANNGYGVYIKGSHATGNRIQGNYIGLQMNGGLALGNWSGGVFVEGAPGNIIGGDSADQGNVVSGNGSGQGTSPTGVIISGGGASGNQVRHNRIGTSADGGSDRGNVGGGLLIDGAPNTVVSDNLIAGNDGDGIRISGGSATGNVVRGNLIGMDAAGITALPNLTPWDASVTDVGVRIVGAPGNTIGGATSAERNFIIGDDYGIYIDGSAASGNVVQGNFVGTNRSGTAKLGNCANGIVISDAPGNTIGGTAGTTPGGACTGACNLLSGNQVTGLTISGSGATGNVVQGNFIGTDVSGKAPVGNRIGISIDGAPNNVIGGTTPAARNLISGNGVGPGIEIQGNGATGNVVQGNFIGTDTTGTAKLGNNGDGIALVGAVNNVIGGATGTTPGGPCTGACNLISGNDDDGVDMDNKAFTGSYASGNKVQGNLIGTDVSGTKGLGNQDNGVELRYANGNLVGGTATGEGNLIAYNGGAGIAVLYGTGNRVDPNIIFSNGGLGIDLGDDGVTANDPADGDSGGNDLQNYPVLKKGVSDTNGTVITGTLDAAAQTAYTLRFFYDGACDASGHGEGRRFLGSKSVTTDGSGHVAFTAAFSQEISPPYRFIAATATDPSGNTSEFSRCLDIAAGPTAVNLRRFTVSNTGQEWAPGLLTLLGGIMLALGMLGLCCRRRSGR
ncbi:MAG: DUF11 domain-containing protein [Chloroflexi bacterium]|nr:DUF11 domain-containing protein [Chloroflexota bacterium]